MRVHAIRTAKGLLIPMNDSLRAIRQDRILLDVEVVGGGEAPEAPDYSALDQLAGLCETGRTDASVNHDAIIYGAGAKG